MVDLSTTRVSISWGSLVRRLLAAFIFASGLAVVSLVGSGSARAQGGPAEWCSIDITTDVNGDLVVTHGIHRLRSGMKVKYK